MKSSRITAISREHRGVLGFLAIAFGLAWAPFVPALFGEDPAAIILMPIAPSIAAIVTRRWITREGFADAGLRPNLHRWPVYLIAISWPVATTFLSLVLAQGLGLMPGGSSLPWGKTAPETQMLLSWMLLAIVLSPIFVGEELGWRGYLQVRLFPGQPLKAAVATGLIWAVWHYPMILVGGQETISRYWALALFPIVGVTLSIFLGWIRTMTGDVWAGSVAHASNNLAENNWHRLAFTGQTDGIPTLSADLLLLTAEVVVLTGLVALEGVRRLSGIRFIGRPIETRQHSLASHVETR